MKAKIIVMFLALFFASPCLAEEESEVARFECRVQASIEFDNIFSNRSTAIDFCREVNRRFEENICFVQDLNSGGFRSAFFWQDTFVGRSNRTIGQARSSVFGQIFDFLANQNVLAFLQFLVLQFVNNNVVEFNDTPLQSQTCQ